MHDKWPTSKSRYKTVRTRTCFLVATSSVEDQMAQSCPETNPSKGHPAHTTWFFETFVLRPFLPHSRPFGEEFHRLFNSYCISLGENLPDNKTRSTSIWTSSPETTQGQSFIGWLESIISISWSQVAERSRSRCCLIRTISRTSRYLKPHNKPQMG